MRPARSSSTCIPHGQVRDARFIFKGRSEVQATQVTWSAGLMYDGPTDEVPVPRDRRSWSPSPRYWGHIFVGRTKEGFLPEQGHGRLRRAGRWNARRSATRRSRSWPTASSGSAMRPKKRISSGISALYTDWLSEGQSFSTYDTSGRRPRGLGAAHRRENERTAPSHRRQRAVTASPTTASCSFARGRRPFRAPYFVDTGKFAAEDTRMSGIRGLLPARPAPGRHRILLSEGQCSGDGQPALPRRRCGRDLAAHRRDARLQHPRRILQPDLAVAPGLPGRARSLGTRRAFLLHRPRQRRRSGAASSGGSRRW